MHEQTGLLSNELYNGKGVNFGLTDDEEKVHENDGEIRTYKSRWLQLTLFCLLSMSNGILWITFSPISNQVQNYYNVSSFYVNSLSMVYMFLFVLLVFPSSWLLDSDTSNRNPVGWEKWVTTGRGLRAAMLIAALGTAGSAILRCFSWPSENGFTVVFLGQMVGGAVQPLILNAPPMVAANWFPAEQRTIATTICSVANPIGVAFGFVIPPTFAGTSLFEPRVELVLLVEALICIVVAILVVVLFREQPPHPPSLSKSSAKISIPLFTSLRTLFTDRNFVILLIGGGCSLGAFNTMATLLNYIIEPYGYNNLQSGVIGAMVVFFGIVGSGVAGVIVDKTRLYKGVLIACFFLSFVFTALFIVFLQRDKFIELTLMCSMFGFFMTPTLPLTLELGCEITYPINEATPSGLLVGGGQVIGILLILISGLLIDAGHVHAACWIVVGCILFAGWLMLMFYGTLHRIMTEKHISQQLALKNDESYFSN